MNSNFNRPSQHHGFSMNLLRWLVIVIVASLLAMVLLNSDHGRAKGTAVPLPNLLSILVCAFLAAVLTKRHWRAFAAPFVAGVAGSIGSLDQFCGPYGVVTGLLVGSLVVLFPDRSLGRPTNRST